MITTVQSLIKLKEDLKIIYKVSKDEIKYFLDDGLSDYVISQKDKFEKLKTFLFQNDRINFYDTFFPLNLKGIAPNGKTYIVEINNNLENVFENGNCITIIGDAGSGKSMLMKHFFLYYLDYLMEIPLFVELRNLNSYEGTFSDYINNLIFNNRLSPNGKILERIMSAGQFLFILDGYDELHDTIKNNRIDEINQFIDKYRKNYFILSSRPGAGVESIPRFNNLKVSEIKRNQIIDFVNRQLSIFENRSLLEEKIIKVIKDPKNEDYLDYMSNPMLLTMFIFTFKNHPELPHAKSEFYYNVFDTLCTRHDNFSKSGDLHQRKTNLKTEDFKDILKWFSYYSYFSGQFNFDKQYFVSKLEHIKKKRKLDFNIDDLIYDLTVNISIIIIDGCKYKFPHRSLQEYFIALLMSQRPTEEKVKDYKKRYFSKQQNHEYNLWTISDELDKYYFRAAAISELDELLGILETNSIENSMLEYLDLINSYVLILKNDKSYYPDMHYYTDWARVLFFFYPKYDDIFFQSFYFSNELEKVIETSTDLQNMKFYNLGAPEYVSIANFVENLRENPIIYNENFYMINFKNEINEYLISYLKEMGLHLYVESLINIIKKIKNNLSESIKYMRQIEDELFDI